MSAESAIASDRRALLAALLGGPRLPPVRADLARRHEPFPLTPIQQAYRLGRNPTFLLGGVGIHGYFEVDCSKLDLARLEQAWNRVIERHDMMRVVIRPDGQAQILPHPPRYTIAMEDLRERSPREQAARCEEIRAELSHQVFDVTRWPLFELRAVLLDDAKTRLFYSEDAIHVDMASSAIILSDWVRLYREPEAKLATLTLSYRDYALALNTYARLGAFAAAEAYWDARLTTLPGSPEIPQRDSGPPGMRFTRRKFVLDAASWTRLQTLAAERGLTPTDVLLTSYALVLGTWSSQQRFLLNVTVQTRLPLHEEIGVIAGDFTTFVLLDVDTSGCESFQARAQRYRDQLWSDLEHAAAGGPGLLRKLARERGDPALLAPFVFTSVLGGPGYRGLGALGEITYEVTQTPQVLVDQQALEVDGELVLTWDSVDDAFVPGTVTVMFAHLFRQLEELASDRNTWTQIRGLELPASQRAAREVMNRTAYDYPVDRLERIFTHCATRRPGQPAIFDRHGVYTYGELESSSSRLARALLAALDATDRAPIAIGLKKGREQVIACLGILKSGRAFLPLDITQPGARIGRILAAARCTTVIVDSTQADGQDFPRVRTISVWAEPDGVCQQPEPVISATDVAYVIFTSGSTGEPKGVMIRHDSVVNRMLDVIERFGVMSEDRALALTALHHDLAIFDVFGMLAFAGGSIVIPTEKVLEAPRTWIDFARERGITVWNSVPAFAEMLIAYAGAAAVAAPALPALRLALLAGDFIPLHLPAALRSLAPQVQFVSLGGPTETTVWDICFPVGQALPGWSSIPYGRPMRNAKYYVLREDFSECPDWVSGELCIGGAGLAMGYINDPELSAQRFVRHPVSGESLYRSGDRGRVRPEGLIEILGRMDRQVKLNGHRIELGEIEGVLREHSAVQRAVAVLTEGCGTRLVAFVTTVRDVSPASPGYSLLGFGDQVRAGIGRYSARAFSKQPVPFAALAELLSTLSDADSVGMTARRRYPSAAAEYAVRPFVHVAHGRVEGLEGGLFQLDATRTRLSVGDSSFLVPQGVHAPWNRVLADQAAFTLYLVAELGKLKQKYGAAARDLCLIESGYIGQLLMCAAAEIGLALCPIGGMETELFRGSFPLSDDAEFTHYLVGGMPPPGMLPARRATGARDASSRVSRGDRTAKQLREFLRSRLPGHMVPSEVRVLRELPLTHNGKIDTAALKRLVEQECAPHHPAPVPTRQAGEVRQEIAAYLAGILRIATVAPDIPFNELGATSVQLVELHGRLAAGGYALELTDLFRYSTVARLADFLHGAVEPSEAAATADAGERQARRLAVIRGRGAPHAP